MDTRLSYRARGLRPGDAHLIRNAGGIVTADALRSLLVSKYLLGTREVMIINHTDCGLMKATEAEIHRRIEKEAGVPANTPVTFQAFRDVADNVRRRSVRSPAPASAKRVASNSLPVSGLATDFAVRGARRTAWLRSSSCVASHSSRFKIGSCSPGWWIPL